MVKLTVDQMHALSKLRDIHTQPWTNLLAILLIVLGLFMLCMIYRYVYFSQRNTARRAGLLLLNRIDTLSPNEQSACVVDILKRVALAYYPRVQVAGLHGEAWLDFLKSSAKNVDFFCIRDLLLVLPYQQSVETQVVDQADLQLLCVYAKKWIKQQKAVKCR